MLSIISALGVLGSLVSTVAASEYQQAVYWGQTDGQPRLSHFCSAAQGIDIIPLAFLSQFGAPYSPGGGFGSCNVTQPQPTGVTPECAEVAKDISWCQSQNKTILVSLGGAIGNYGLSNQSDAEAVAQDVWNQYGPMQKGYTGPRPFGENVVVDGFDMDIENNVGAYNYIFFIEKLRALFATDSSKSYYISGAPQCVVPDASMGDMIFNTIFDYLFLQFYNTPTCSARGKISGYGPTGGINQYFTFDAWRQFTNLSYSKSKGSKLLIGLPASVDAASLDDENRPYYLTPTEALQLINEYKTHDGFAGVMLYDAGTSDTNVVDGCTYSQQIRSILSEGKTC